MNSQTSLIRKEILHQSTIKYRLIFKIVNRKLKFEKPLKPPYHLVFKAFIVFYGFLSVR